MFKKFVIALGALALSLIQLTPVMAQPAYPYNNPTYIPTAQLAPQVFTAIGVYDFVANGVGGASVTVSALTGTLAATIQGANDNISVADASANWSTLYYVPAVGGAAANSITANGTYLFNTAGFTRFRVNIGTLSGGSATVTVQAAATVAPNLIYNINPNSGVAPTVNQGDLPYPIGAVPETISATGTTAATTATLAAAAGKTTYICGFRIIANATAAATGNATITGTITGTLNFTQWTAPLASNVGNIGSDFSKCIPASAANTAIAVVSAAPGSGGTVSVSAWGFQL